MSNKNQKRCYGSVRRFLRIAKALLRLALLALELLSRLLDLLS
jgi:hypothetical protein